jgi:hypothetical protein
MQVADLARARLERFVTVVEDVVVAVPMSARRVVEDYAMAAVIPDPVTRRWPELVKRLVRRGPQPS